LGQHTPHSTLEMTIKYKQNSCQEQQAGQEQDTEQVECPEAIPEANFKCGNNNSCCGGEVRDEIRKEKKRKTGTQRKVHKTYLETSLSST